MISAHPTNSKHRELQNAKCSCFAKSWRLSEAEQIHM